MSWYWHFFLLAAAIALDAIVGDPDFVWRRIPHPVAALGGAVTLLDRALNFRRAWPSLRRSAGILAVAILVIVATAIGYGLERLFASFAYGWVVTLAVTSVLLAGRSLFDHVLVVARAFDTGGLAGGRRAVARIVGRDPESLDEAGVCRAAIESTAENFSDGLVAPVLWFAILGLPGLLAYKAINTADSMIGHLTPRHRDFGRAAARLDDLVNLPASRLAGFLIALAAPLAQGSAGRALRTMAEDAGKHRSPNAGWPEAAMAGALGIALAGPRRYRGALVNDPFLNAGGRRQATPADIRRGLRVYAGAWALLFALVIAVGGVAYVASRLGAA